MASRKDAPRGRDNKGSRSGGSSRSAGRGASSGGSERSGSSSRGAGRSTGGKGRTTGGTGRSTGGKGRSTGTNSRGGAGTGSSPGRQGGSYRDRSAAAGASKGSARGPDGDRRAGGAERRGDREDGDRKGGAPRRYTKGKGRPVEDEGIPGNQRWGGLARKGVLRANLDERRGEERAAERALRPETDEEVARAAKAEARAQQRAERDARQADLRAQAKAAVDRANTGAPKPRKRAAKPKPAFERAELPKGPARNEDEVEALNRLLGPADAKKQLRKLRAAAESFEAERYADARKSLKAIVELAPSVPEIRELYGLTLYRSGQYKEAARQLEEFRVLAGSVEQNPVLADCYRAQQRWADVEELWAELTEVSPSAALVNEGRIVMAGALADRGDLDAGVRLLEKGWRKPPRPMYHHLRRAYALADLYERSGDLPRARALFDWVLKHDRDFVDTRQRLANLR